MGISNIWKPAIPRGIIYHKLTTDVKWLLSSFIAKLDDSDEINKFEGEFAKFVGTRHCVAFPFARIAIYYVLKSLNLPAGSEILMPPITIKAILDVVLDLGLKPVFVDLNPDTICFDPEELNKSINPNTKVALITYLFGMVPNLDKMTAQLKENNIYVIEDFSQCLGGKFNGKKTGTFGDVGIYSASSIKTLDTYGGGMAVSNDEDLIERLRKDQINLWAPNRKLLSTKIYINLKRNLLTNRFLFHFIGMPAIKLITAIRPDLMIKHTGHRSKDMIDKLPDEWFCGYTSLQAKVGLEQIRKVNRQNAERINNVEEIRKSAKNIGFPAGVKGANNVYWQMIAQFNDAKKIQKYLHTKNIDSSTSSLELISRLEKYPYQGDTPNAVKLYTNGLLIPAFSSLRRSDVKRIREALSSFEEKVAI